MKFLLQIGVVTALLPSWDGKWLIEELPI